MCLIYYTQHIRIILIQASTYSEAILWHIFFPEIKFKKMYMELFYEFNHYIDEKTKVKCISNFKAAIIVGVRAQKYCLLRPYYSRLCCNEHSHISVDL